MSNIIHQTLVYPPITKDIYSTLINATVPTLIKNNNSLISATLPKLERYTFKGRPKINFRESPYSINKSSIKEGRKCFPSCEQCLALALISKCTRVNFCSMLHYPQSQKCFITIYHHLCNFPCHNALIHCNYQCMI